jgi:hypothetical protein
MAGEFPRRGGWGHAYGGGLQMASEQQPLLRELQRVKRKLKRTKQALVRYQQHELPQASLCCLTLSLSLSLSLSLGLCLHVAVLVSTLWCSRRYMMIRAARFFRSCA